MKRVMVLLVIAILVLTVMGFATAVKTSSRAKAGKATSVSSDQISIEKAVLAWDDARLKNKQPTALRSVKFGSIKIVSGWATTTYNHLDSKSKVIPSDTWTYILHKTKGKWQVAMKSELVAIDIDQCKKIGLPQSVAKKLKVLMDWD